MTLQKNDLHFKLISMKLLLCLFCTVTLLISSESIIQGQITQITFGDVPNEDLELTSYKQDPSADAVVLDDYCQITMSETEGINVIVDRHIRMKIINTDGLDYANVEIPYSTNDKITNVKAASYNIEKGTPLTHILDKKSFYYEKTSRYLNTLRFAFTNVHVGSVIEFRYTLRSSDFFSLYTMDFQREIPVRFCSLVIKIPGYFTYKFIPKGNFSNVRFSSSEENVFFGRSSVKGYVGRWSAPEIPAYRVEPYSTGSDDYYTSLGFELSKIEVPGYYFEEVSPTYANLSKKLLAREDFGRYFLNSAFLQKKALEVSKDAESETEKLKRIYEYVTNKITWNGNNDFTANTTMKKVYNDEKGSSADINLLFMAMLKEAGLIAKPVIFSTRENGKIDQMFAILQRFNNVAVVVRADGNEYVVDATDPLRPFNLLPFECLNGKGWIVDSYDSRWIDIRNGECYSELISLDLALDANGRLSGSSTNIYGGYSAYLVKKLCKLEGIEGYNDLQQSVNNSWKISDVKLIGLDANEGNVSESFSLVLKDGVEIKGDRIFLDPVVYDRMESNPYYSDERISPIDFGCPEINSYKCRILIPDGYEIEELPSSLKVSLPEKGGEFLYNVTGDGRYIIVETRLNITRTEFDAKDYENIRQLWSRILEKQSEVIILKRKNEI